MDMTNRDNYWRHNFGFGSRLFEEIDKEFAEAEDMMSRVFKTVSELGPSEQNSNSPYFYGYQMTVGPDGVPHVKEFGNIRPAQKGLAEQKGVREPLVDVVVDEKEKALRITAEMPGVTKNDVKVKVSNNSVTIHAESGEKKYHADVPVDVSIEDKAAKATYSNGILELKIKLKSAVKKHEGTDVKVE